MQILNILTKLRKEMAETEHTITQAWQRYSKELSTKALAEAHQATGGSAPTVGEPSGTYCGRGASALECSKSPYPTAPS
jgi:hypothetical protein